MERKYLVAAVAMVATFAVFSTGGKSLARLSAKGARVEAMIGSKCGTQSAAAAQWATKVSSHLRSHLRPRYAEEAQLLAEMNLPIAMVQAKVGEQRARQLALAECARATALRDMERARRDMLKLKAHNSFWRCHGSSSNQPIAFEEDPNEQFARTMSFAIATNIARQQKAMAEQMARQASQMQQFNVSMDQFNMSMDEFNKDQNSAGREF